MIRRRLPWTAPLILAAITASGDLHAAPSESTIPGWPPKLGASVWTRYEMRENYDRLGVSRGRFQEGNFAVYRARFTLETAPIALGSGPEVVLRFSPQADGFWGDQPSTISNPNVGFYEAFLRLQGESYQFDVGHFSMNYGDALIIGDLRWHQRARSFDGARLRLDAGPGSWFDLFFTQLDEGLGGTDPTAFAGDVFFTGMYASLGQLLSTSTTLEPYFLAQIWTSQSDGDAVVARSAVQGTAGLRFVQKAGAVDFRFEGGFQFGKRRVGAANPDVTAFQVDGEIGVTVARGFRLSLGGLFASGDDPTTGDKLESYDELFPTTHKFLGLSDVIGIRSNIASGVFHLKYAGLKRWVFLFDQHLFVRPETAEGQPSFAGVESDLNIVYKLGNGMTLRTLYALFVPGDDHFQANDIVHYVELQYGINL
ncbi:MAG: alginate export family protein [Myxococcota bacterium]